MALPAATALIVPELTVAALVLDELHCETVQPSRLRSDVTFCVAPAVSVSDAILNDGDGTRLTEIVLLDELVLVHPALSVTFTE